MNDCQLHNLGVQIAAANTPKSPDSAFLDGSIESVYDTEAVTLRAYAFQNCTSLTTATFTALTSIATTNVFDGCSALSSLTVPELATITGSNTFNGCTNLKTVSFPNLTNYTAGTVFFENVTFGASSLSGVILSGKSTIKSISAPNATAVSTRFAFRCGGLTSVSLPKLASTTHEYASSTNYSTFAYCTALASVNFPEMATIGIRAFFGCTALMSITLGSTGHAVSSIGIDAFSGVPSGATIIIYTADGQPLTSDSPWGWTGDPTTGITWRQA